MNSNGSDNCKPKPKLKFHFDVSTAFCMNFQSNECQKNENSFDSVGTCASTCLKENYKGCPFRRNPVIPFQCRSNKDCNRNVNSDQKDLLYCTREGTCCKSADLAELRSVFNVTCPPGRQKVQYTYKSSTRLLIGKSCDSKMCPVNSTCHKETYFAFCCL
ncbi:hypothetical protein CRE_27221 [Caenorhabditis remanei]|uniref:BPTI/Kunitz inhibitor domain-containing protein n=1 Tax=Caenorhabditis remanei TaxID=31234 RepID=E3LP56_CAERE|nr:hypothetical protein CRE_27221 [Caenorhabditis remanei]